MKGVKLEPRQGMDAVSGWDVLVKVAPRIWRLAGYVRLNGEGQWAAWRDEVVGVYSQKQEAVQRLVDLDARTEHP